MNQEEFDSFVDVVCENEAERKELRLVEELSMEMIKSKQIQVYRPLSRKLLNKVIATPTNSPKYFIVCYLLANRTIRDFTLDVVKEIIQFNLQYSLFVNESKEFLFNIPKSKLQALELVDFLKDQNDYIDLSLELALKFQLNLVSFLNSHFTRTTSREQIIPNLVLKIKHSLLDTLKVTDTPGTTCSILRIFSAMTIFWSTNFTDIDITQIMQKSSIPRITTLKLVLLMLNPQKASTIQFVEIFEENSSENYILALNFSTNQIQNVMKMLSTILNLQITLSSEKYQFLRQMILDINKSSNIFLHTLKELQKTRTRENLELLIPLTLELLDVDLLPNPIDVLLHIINVLNYPNALIIDLIHKFCKKFKLKREDSTTLLKGNHWQILLISFYLLVVKENIDEIPVIKVLEVAKKEFQELYPVLLGLVSTQSIYMDVDMYLIGKEAEQKVFSQNFCIEDFDPDSNLDENGIIKGCYN
jgi:hypothetical protein